MYLEFRPTIEFKFSSEDRRFLIELGVNSEVDLALTNPIEKLEETAGLAKAEHDELGPKTVERRAAVKKLRLAMEKWVVQWNSLDPNIRRTLTFARPHSENDIQAVFSQMEESLDDYAGDLAQPANRPKDRIGRIIATGVAAALINSDLEIDNSWPGPFVRIIELLLTIATASKTNMRDRARKWADVYLDARAARMDRLWKKLHEF